MPPKLKVELPAREDFYRSGVTRTRRQFTFTQKIGVELNRGQSRAAIRCSYVVERGQVYLHMYSGLYDWKKKKYPVTLCVRRKTRNSKREYKTDYSP